MIQGAAGSHREGQSESPSAATRPGQVQAGTMVPSPEPPSCGYSGKHTCPTSALLLLSLTKNRPPRSSHGHGADDVIATLTLK